MIIRHNIFIESGLKEDLYIRPSGLTSVFENTFNELAQTSGQAHLQHLLLEIIITGGALAYQ
jgi:hypothetical protein